MFVKATVTETREIKKHIELPYYSKSGGDSFYRINEDESVLKVFINSRLSQLSVSPRSNMFNSMFLEEAVNATPCDAEEVEAAAKKYFESVEPTINTLAESV